MLTVLCRMFGFNRNLLIGIANQKCLELNISITNRVTASEASRVCEIDLMLTSCLFCRHKSLDMTHDRDLIDSILSIRVRYMGATIGYSN